MGIFLLSLKNLRRKPVRTAAILLAMAALSGALFTLSVIYYSVNNSIIMGSSRLGADALVVPTAAAETARGIVIAGIPSEFYIKEDVASRVGEIPGVEATASQLFVISAPLSCCTVSDTMLIGFDPERDFTVSPWLRETFHRSLQDNEAVVGANILVEPDGKIRFYGTEFIAAGRLERTGMRFIDGAVFIPISGAREMIEKSGDAALKTLTVKKDEISAVLVRFERDARPEEVALRIENSVRDAKVLLSSDIMRRVRRNLLLPLKSIVAAGLIQWALSLFLAAVIYSMTVEERTKEIGVLTALGAKKSDVLRVFVYEVVLVCLAGGIAGAASGFVLLMSFRNLLAVFFSVPFLLPSPARLIFLASAALLLTVLSGLGSTFYSILRKSRSFPLETVQAGS